MRARIIRETWADLSKPIYVGERLEENLKALTAVSAATALLAVCLIVMHITKGEMIGLLVSVLTLLSSFGCAFFAGIRKDRPHAALIPAIFCGIMFTIYALTGLGNGQFILWVFLVPIGIGYFVSAKYSIILCLYYTALFAFVFYGPFAETLSAYASSAFRARFMMLFVSLSAFTGIALVQYHRSVLFEIEHTGRLNEEVERQTRVATKRAQRLETITNETVEMLAYAIDAKDRYTNGHSFRVSWYSVAIAQRLGLTDEELGVLQREALLHDIGKIGVPDSILNKPGKLSDEEFEIIKSHTAVGDRILARSDDMHGASQVARHHHERYDGKGYPDGLSGEAIPFHARIVAIADAYDAMRSDRIYRKGLPLDVIRNELVKGRGTQFDPSLLDVFLGLCDDGALDEIAVRDTTL